MKLAGLTNKSDNKVSDTERIDKLQLALEDLKGSNCDKSLDIIELLLESEKKNTNIVIETDDNNNNNDNTIHKKLFVNVMNEMKSMKELLTYDENNDTVKSKITNIEKHLTNDKLSREDEMKDLKALVKTLDAKLTNQSLNSTREMDKLFNKFQHEAKESSMFLIIVLALFACIVAFAFANHSDAKLETIFALLEKIQKKTFFN